MSDYVEKLMQETDSILLEKSLKIQDNIIRQTPDILTSKNAHQARYRLLSGEESVRLGRKTY